MNLALSTDEMRDLDEVGFVVLPDFFVDMLAPLRDRIEAIFAEEGDDAGSEFKREPGCRRLANLVDKGAVFRQVISHPRLLPYIQHVLGERFIDPCPAKWLTKCLTRLGQRRILARDGESVDR